MADEVPVETPKDAPKPVAVSQEDLSKFRAAYDTKITALAKELEEARKEAVMAKADTETLKSQGDNAKVLEREQMMRVRETKVSAFEQDLRVRELHQAAVETAAEAKAKWGLDVKVEDLAKLPTKGDMALAVMRLATPPAVKPADKPKFADMKVVRAEPTRYGQSGDLVEGLTDMLRKHGRIA